MYRLEARWGVVASVFGGAARSSAAKRGLFEYDTPKHRRNLSHQLRRYEKLSANQRKATLIKDARWHSRENLVFLNENHYHYEIRGCLQRRKKHAQRKVLT